MKNRIKAYLTQQALMQTKQKLCINRRCKAKLNHDERGHCSECRSLIDTARLEARRVWGELEQCAHTN